MTEVFRRHEQAACTLSSAAKSSSIFSAEEVQESATQLLG
jgi:hypothetical protein